MESISAADAAQIAAVRAAVARYATAWLARSPSRDTRSNYARDVGQFLAFAGIPPYQIESLAAVRPHRVAAWRDYLTGQGAGDQGSCWTPGTNHTLRTSQGERGTPRPDRQAGAFANGFGSPYAGGCNFAFCDGSEDLPCGQLDTAHRVIDKRGSNFAMNIG